MISGEAILSTNFMIHHTSYKGKIVILKNSTSQDIWEIFSQNFKFLNAFAKINNQSTTV
jgi:hypothetical protein